MPFLKRGVFATARVVFHTFTYKCGHTKNVQCPEGDENRLQQTLYEFINCPKCSRK